MVEPKAPSARKPPLVSRVVRPPSPRRALADELPSPRDLLRATLPTAVGLLKAHRASEIDATAIEDYVRLNWLEWQGGDLKLTETGSNICKQAVARRV